MRCRRAPVEPAPGRRIQPSIHRTKASLGVLRRIPCIVLERGAPVQVEGVLRETGQKIEPWLEDRDQIAGGRTGGREDIAVEDFIDFCLREPKKVTDMQPDRIKFRARPLGYG